MHNIWYIANFNKYRKNKLILIIIEYLVDIKKYCDYPEIYSKV